MKQNRRAGHSPLASCLSLLLPCRRIALYFVMLTALLGNMPTLLSNNALTQERRRVLIADVPANNQRYEYPPVLYGHVHMAKTGGTSLNGMLANRFTRVCGNKGYSFDAYNANLRAKQKEANGERVVSEHEPRDRIKPAIMNEIGFHDCDFISQELPYDLWIKHFGDSKFFGIPMELHVPCREPLDHL
eukprot:scaffold27013_cov122-Cylindrotheca_fusiformis.AAC.1